MTIGRKITQLRTAKGLSQEQLAEALDISRQSVSKWEMDQSLPQIDKVLQLADLFGISTDALLRDSAPLAVTPKTRKRYFGTDGFRGEANAELTSMHAYKIGRFLGWYYASALSGCDNPAYRPRILIGKDTRRSSYMLEYSLVAGITASGADAYMLHVTTTPSVSYITRQDGFDCGIMITASHNPYQDNGIKIVNAYGEKLDDATISLIEHYLDGDLPSLGISEDLPVAKGERVGCIHDFVSGRNRYTGYLISVASNSYKNLKIGLDCANGACWNIARSVFGALGAQIHVISAEPDGVNVNRDCGAAHPEALCRLVKDRHLDMGFAFDGDADRCIAVDENGNVVDGDKILYILARRLQGKGMLNGDTVVSTVMSNSGFVNALKQVGIHCVQTAVGDKSVYECMQTHDYCLGGEKSGHIIMRKYATTGDGLLTAIMLCEQVCDSKRTLAALCERVTFYSQITLSLPVKSKQEAFADKTVQEALSAVTARIGKQGRALLRESGTEPVIRVMVECESEEKCNTYAQILADALRAGGHIPE
jgi:phosphoglucosamine mutase